MKLGTKVKFKTLAGVKLVGRVVQEDPVLIKEITEEVEVRYFSLQSVKSLEVLE